MEYTKRDQIDAQYKWRLEDIYATDEHWEQDYEKLESRLQEVSGIKKTLTKDVQHLADALKKIEEIEHIAANLYVYARMRRDENNADAKYQGMTARAMDINVRFSSALSFVSPALLALAPGVLEGYIEQSKQLEGNPLGEFDFMLEELLRARSHVLSEKEEKILASLSEMAGAPKDIFTMLNNADLEFGKVKDDTGKTVPLTHGSYIVLMQSEDRKVRKNAYEKMYGAYKQHINTISTAYAANVKKNVVYTRVKKYESALQRALFSDNVPVSLYENLIKTVHGGLDTMYRYLDTRKKVLKVDQLHMYDVYAPLVRNVDTDYPYEKAMEMVKEGLLCLGSDYQTLLETSQKEGWIDVYETPGKTSGAYSWGVYGVHPYVLLNHRGDLDSVFTIAHELGHAMHSWHSNAYQPEAKAGYTIFVAEVASTVNEILLTHYLLKTVQDKEMRKYVLNHYLDQFRTTVLRQTMFAEFEKMAHEAVERGEPLTYESLCALYGGLNELYHGPSMAKDDTIVYEWARIPHFYNAFYVYKYATGFSCAVNIASDIMSGKKDAVKNYIKFLSSGGSDHPLNLLKIAGIDLASGEPVRVCMQEFEKALTEFEKALS